MSMENILEILLDWNDQQMQISMHLKKYNKNLDNSVRIVIVTYQILTNERDE